MSLNTTFRRATSSTGPSTTLSKTLLSSPSTTTTTSTSTYICNQCRHATLLRRPKRPYTFTQLVALSDGSTFLHRTTSPMPVYRSTRDTRNSLLWNPTSKKLLTVEDDEAGRLAAFRAKFGRGFDAAAATATAESKTGDVAGQQARTEKQVEADAAAAKALAQEEAELQEEEDNLLDLISSFGQDQESAGGKKKK
ncbi:hypothetical protein UA08_04831 [Talaromyces atroroseus]|uniref:Ribosomal protein bL31m N-terminal domain-containing protein n=1 Tax=Talaromyces atroroseus TaxID=1441469 RepID=A0A225B0F5_TALAT|nr:hypothetical protein UA08_04831 [Talaromyces atroroseus]OKL60215.1 hypothetical protein UA08_04831 [Talaromyces atroroseus]